MAEARSAVSSSFGVTSSEEEIILRINKDAIPAILRAIKKASVRRIISIRNAVINSIFPASPLQWAVSVATPLAILSYKNKYTTPLAEYMWQLTARFPFQSLKPTTPMSQKLTLSILGGTGVFLALSFARRVTLRLLLSYRGWLYEAPRSQSWSTILWGVALRVFTGSHSHALTYSFQNSLPHLPVPSLKKTCARYLESVRSLQSPEEFALSEELVRQFLRNEGPRLQRYLMLKWLVSPNYVTDWWEKYVYLRGRSPIMVNSNYYALDAPGFLPTTNQCARAATIIHAMITFKIHLENEEIDPILIRDTVPLCMAQYERTFTTTRIPGKECDRLEHYDGSTYVAVLRKGRFYQLSVVNSKDQRLTAWELESQLRWIIDDAERGGPVSKEELHLPALTAGDRTVWANAREEHFSHGVNKETLDIIEKAIFVVSLDDESPADLTAQGKALLHGSGYNRWFDKSITAVFFPNGRCGLNCEHSWADAPVIAHMWEWTMVQEQYESYDSEGHCVIEDSGNKPRTTLAPPRKLAWNVSPKLAQTIETATSKAAEICNDLDLKILIHDKYGKDFMKKAKISPDAYFQMALQLAYYRDSKGQFALTYESSMTRLYLHGRTETVRPASMDSKNFVLAMDDKSISKKEKINLLFRAGETHQSKYRDAMSGKGVDRHLFSLYVVSQGLGVDSPFLKDALSRTWRLSTSQQPQQQTKLWDPDHKDRHRVGPGGGFGPVDDNGYGTSYMFAASHMVAAHVSSKYSSPLTNSTRFAENIEKALEDMAELFS